MKTLAVNVVGAVITVVLFLSGNLGLGLISAFFFGIVAIRLANLERTKDARAAGRRAALEGPHRQVPGDFDWEEAERRRQVDSPPRS